MATREVDREIDTVTNKSDYANICVYIKQLEAISLPQLYRALTSYLSILMLPSAQQYLDTYQEHVSDSYSWLAKAQCAAQAETQRDFAKQQALAAGTGLDQSLWDDAAKKLNYLIEGWDTDVATACQQIVQGIVMLVNENIPLSEVQGEIIEFAQGRGVTALVVEHESEVAKKLKHLLSDAWVNSVTALVKLARTVTVQADLFLNRLTQSQTDFSGLDTKQSFLFEANQKLCAFIEAQFEGLRAVVNNFPAMLAAKIVKRLEKITIESVLQRYNHYCGQVMVFTPEPISNPIEAIEDEDEDEFEAELEAVEQAPVIATEIKETKKIENEKVENIAPAAATTRSPAVTAAKVDQLFSTHETILESVIKQISLHRLQLSCSSRIKACYAKFSLFPLFRRIATHLSSCQNTLTNSMSELTSAHRMMDLAEQTQQRFRAIHQALENSATRIDTYLKTLNIHHVDYDVTVDIPGWQSKIHELIMSSSEDELLIIDSRLQRIEVLESPYLRATLIMRLHVTKFKLNDMIMANMQSWSSRLVDHETVVNTLNYLGIHIQPHHLNKIAPNIRVVKKKVNRTKDFYSSAADYGLMAFRNVRAWLDKQVIS